MDLDRDLRRYKAPLLSFSVLVGDRDDYFANALLEDVASCLAPRAQLTPDGYKSYLNADAAEGVFGADVDYPAREAIRSCAGSGRPLQPRRLHRRPPRGS